jgi:hypothetical protein
LQSNARVNDSSGQWRITLQPSSPADKTRTQKIKLENVAYFSTPKNSPPNHRVHHAIHHDFTTQKPCSSTHFFKKHPQKRPKIDEIPPATTPKKIPPKNLI